MRPFILCALVLSIGGVAAGCSGDIDNIPTTPDPIPVTETYTGSININGAATHPVFTGATGAVIATITSLGDNAPAKIGFSMGTLAGTTCSVVLYNDSAGVTTSLAGTVASLNGTLCLRIYDVGALTESVPYTFTVTHP
jgi:hypothetical protein